MWLGEECDMANDRSYHKRMFLGLQSIDAMPSRLRRQFLRWSGMEIAATAFIEAGVSFVAGHLDLGSDCYINTGCLLDARGGIAIGARTLLGPRVAILTATHAVSDGYPRAAPATFSPVRIGPNSWIGAAATILPGTIIGQGCVVAAGSLVRGTLDGDALYAGVPAIKKRDLPRNEYSGIGQ